MGKKLIIVESPAKAKTIGKFAGNKYQIKASMGHIRDLPKSSFGVDIENGFKPKYVVDRAKTKIIKQLKEATSSSDEVFIASDHDREGEAIAWHLSEVLKKEIGSKPLHRIVFNEITRKAINESLKKPDKINMNKVDSQQTRRILDRIVGYNISPILWKSITKGTSAGRVQSVALRMVCEREEEIKTFVPKEYWNITAEFSDIENKDLPPFKASLDKYNGKKATITNKLSADEVTNKLSKENYSISDIKKKQRMIQPYPPYITSTMQQDAARLLNFSAKKTMMIAQQLYEGIDIGGETIGLITYMRTDSVRMANEAIEKSRNLIKERYGEIDVNKTVRVFKNKNKAQDAHEAIRPTDPYRTPEIMNNLNKDQLRLYTLIWQRFIATQIRPVRLETVTINISSESALFVSKGSIILDEGFLKAYPHTKIALGEKIDKEYRTGSALEMKNLNAVQNFTKPPARYTESSLIKELEAKGIGRPSTYATITNTIVQRKYVEKKNKQFVPTELGLTVNKVLVAHFESFFNLKFTAEMEESLDKVEYGKEKLVDVLSRYYKALDDLIQKLDIKKLKTELVEETDLICEKCGGKMVIKWGKNGQFLACSNYPKCKNTKNFKRDENGKIIIIEETKTSKDKKLDEKCPKCGGDLVIKKGRYGEFIACSNYPKCKYTRPITTGVKCPECHKGELVERRTKKGRKFYACTNYPECKFIMNDKPINTECPNCKNPYIVEKYSKTEGTYLECPNCKTKFKK